MKVLIVYDSQFGNTEKVAKVIAATFGIKEDINLVKVDIVKPEDMQSLDILIVGSPIHAWGPTKGMKSFMKSLNPGTLSGVRAAAFDTGYPARMAGSAAPKIEKALSKSGCSIVAPAMKFAVTGNKGPLAEGELDKATAWAKEIK
ncbi:flavodoxin family protein [Chloroflexota bacterium]